MMRLASLLSIIALCLGLFQPLQAQEQNDPSKVISDSLQKSETAKTGLLVLQFSATGMTDSSAMAYSMLIAQNMANANRFIVTNPKQSVDVIMNEAPKLLPCFEIGCGIQMAKIMGAERVLSGHISLTPSGRIKLLVKMVNVNDNLLEFEEAIRFTDETMDRRFYSLAQKIAHSTPLKGRILEANNRMAITDLGAYDGIKVGDRLIIFKILTVQAEGTEILKVASRRSNIGILTITKVGDHSSEGVYFQTIETPKPGEYVSTFLEKPRQIALVNDVRKELDTHQRNVYEVEKKVEILPISIEDIDKKNWIYRVRITEDRRDWWQNWVLGAGIATALVMSQYSSGDDLKALAAISTMSYSTFRYFQSRKELKGLVEEGKFKGYLDLRFRPETPAAGVTWTYHF